MHGSIRHCRYWYVEHRINRQIVQIGRTLKFVVVLVVNIAVGARSFAQEALLVVGLHVDEQFVVTIKAPAAEAALRVPLEAALCHRACQVAAAIVALQIRLAVCYLLRNEHL